jgi:hypothetical protein
MGRCRLPMLLLGMSLESVAQLSPASQHNKHGHKFRCEKRTLERIVVSIVSNSFRAQMQKVQVQVASPEIVAANTDPTS